MSFALESSPNRNAGGLYAGLDQSTDQHRIGIGLLDLVDQNKR